MTSRQLIYIPEIAPHTFVFFYSEGDSGRFYSIRDYTVALDPPRLTYAMAYPYVADEILGMARWRFDADRVSTKDVAYWRAKIEALNRRYLGKAEGAEKQLHPPRQAPTQGETSGPVLSILGSSGQPICSVEDWFRLAPRKMGSKHWKDGRSAKELAKAFCAPRVRAVPTELRDLLASSDQLGAVQFTQAWPEHKIRLDSFFGETRNADLAAVGTGKAGVTAVTIEAKADEPFGPTIAHALAQAGVKSKVPQRISSLSKALFDPLPPNLGALRYQLLHGIAATLIFAKEQKAAAAVFIVFEFQGLSCSEQNLQGNAVDLDAFVLALGPAASPITTGQIAGPLRVPGGGRVPSNIPLFIGKAVHLVSERSVSAP